MENNKVVKKETNSKGQVAISTVIQGDWYKNLVNSTLNDPKRIANLTTTITSAVATNPDLQKCDPYTIISAGLKGASLGLSLALGDFYIVPFKDNKNDRYVGQYQLGYIGIYQLAIRSGQYKKLDVVEVKEGELLDYNPFDGGYKFGYIKDPKERAKAKTIGFYAYYELLNGFRTEMFSSVEEIEKHAMTYSMGYKAKKGYTFWEKNWNVMAIKTMYRQLLKLAPKSVEMEQALQYDMSVINKDGTFDYIDNPQDDLGSKQVIVEQDDIDLDEKKVDEKTGEVIVEQKSMNFDDI